MPDSNIQKAKLEDCAMLVIDMQADFIKDGAPLECPGAREVIPKIKKLLEFAHAHKIPVIYTQEVHRTQKIDFGTELEKSAPEHCLEGSPGVEIISELAPQDADFVVRKRRFSAFYLTDLEIILKGLQKKTLIITGVSTNVCVYATTLDAQQRDHQAIVVKDCTAGTSAELHRAFLENIAHVLGDVVTSDELVEVLSKS